MATNQNRGSDQIPIIEIGQRFVVTIEKVAHGGHFIARHLGRVFFVRHALPGEIVEIEVTSIGSTFVRADAVSVIEKSSDRVVALCEFSGAGKCGGCDFQHVSPTRQRELKADVIREQFDRLAKLDIEVFVEEIGEPIHWRTRLSSATNSEGKIGFYGFRSHDVIDVKDCLIATKEIDFSTLARRIWPKNSRVEISVSSAGERTIALAPNVRGSKARITEGKKILHEEISGHALQVSHNSFWQSHQLAPEILAEAVRVHVQESDRVLDLYGGVGLFTAAILDTIGEEGEVDLIESSPGACSDALLNFTNFPNVRIHKGDVERLLPQINKADVIILDPPREGAGKNVLMLSTALNPRSIVYIACDPAALARDCAYLSELGYTLNNLRAFDLFPMTHHIECVAVFEASQK